MGIEDILMHDESLFQNINAFDPDYLPPNYNYRDTQMEAMAMAIRPAMRGGQPSNAVVLGSPATGKTTAIKKVYELVGLGTDVEIKESVNVLGMIPVIEYNRAIDRTGCFERHISYMDGLNILVSDLANDTAQTVQQIWWGNDVSFTIVISGPSPFIAGYMAWNPGK